MTFKVILLVIAVGLLIPFIFDDSFAQIITGSSSDRDFNDIKYIDAYFGTPGNKIQVDSGDNNVPFTVVLVNIGSNDITGISGQLSLPLGFSSSSSAGSHAIINSDGNANAITGEDFYLTFSVNIDPNVRIQEYPGTIKVDYSRLRESGIRTTFVNFDFKVTGDSVINVKSTEQFLTSLQSNDIVIEITNDGTAPISNVNVVVENTQSDLMASSQPSNMNIEKIVMSDSSWHIGNVDPQSTAYISTSIYVPESLIGDTLHIPISITYYDVYGEVRQISKSVDFYVQGLIDLTIFNIDVIELSDVQIIVGEIINEGNQGGLFGFVTVEPGDGSNIKPNTQFIDEIETDAPVPFNIPVEFDGEPRYGEHDITVTLRYKNSLRDEIFLTQQQTIFINEPVIEETPTVDDDTMIIGAIIVAAIVVAIIVAKRKRRADDG